MIAKIYTLLEVGARCPNGTVGASMDVIVTTEARFHGAPGPIRSETGGRSYSFWTRYLDVFDSVVVVARVAEDSHESTSPRVEGPRVAVCPVSDYRGTTGFMRRAREIQSTFRRLAAEQPRPLIARVPGPLGSSAVRAWRAIGAPYALEVVGDPGESLGNHSFRHPLRGPVRNIACRSLRADCDEADGVAYVTSGYLQEKYPANRGTTIASYSDVAIPPQGFADAPRLYETTPSRLRIVNVGSMSLRYKGQDTLLQAVSSLRRGGENAQLRLVGDGKLRSSYEWMAQDLGIQDAVSFAGKLEAGAAVVEELDAADIFVLTSRTEGLPRALIEAMARGLPCVATAVGGVPEIIAKSELVQADDALALSSVIEGMANDPKRLTSLSSRNLTLSKQYSDDKLREKRVAFYQAIKERFELYSRSSLGRDNR